MSFLSSAWTTNSMPGSAMCADKVWGGSLAFSHRLRDPKTGLALDCDPAVGNGSRPARCSTEAAEREEMRADMSRRGIGERANEIVRHGECEQLPDQARALRQRLRR